MHGQSGKDGVGGPARPKRFREGSGPVESLHRHCDGGRNRGDAPRHPGATPPPEPRGEPLKSFLETQVLLAGGAIYDAILGYCALTAKAETIYRWNPRDFLRLAPAIYRIPFWTRGCLAESGSGAGGITRGTDEGGRLTEP
jgi:hypothetical protein